MPLRPNAFEIVWRNPWVRAVCYTALIAGAVIFLIRARSGYIFALQVGLVGFGLAYILNPIVNALQRIRIRRGLAVVLVYILLLNILILGSILITQVIVQLGEFIGLIPEAFDSISRYLGTISTRVSGWLSGTFERLPNFFERFGFETSSDQLSLEAQARIQEILSGAVTNINGLLRRLLSDGPSLLLSGAASIISTTLQIILILLASAYFLFDFPKFVESFRLAVPTRYRRLFTDLSQKADRAVGGYLRGQLLITLILGVLIYIGLSIAGVPLALAISFLAAIFNLVPYLGPIIGVIPAVLLGFTVSPWTAFWAVIVFIIANQLEGNVLAPYILSKNTNLHPVTVLLAILVGAGMFGLLGALLAVPVVALLKVVLDSI